MNQDKDSGTKNLFQYLKTISSLLLFGIACASFAWAHITLVPSRMAMALCAYGISAALLFIRDILFPSPTKQHTYHPWASLASLITIVSLACFFRLRYVCSVPISYNDEQMVQFLGYASRLLREGFTYSPLWGYASTLHTYMIALVWKVFGQSLANVRYYTAFWGILSAVTMFWWLKQLFGFREALVGGILLATSPYHQWACRAGYNTPYIPLFVMLFFGLLYKITMSAQKIPLAITAGVVFTLGMHGHWAFALEVPAAILFIAYCAITERGFLKTSWIALATLVVAITIFMTPFATYFLRDVNRSGYIRKATDCPPGGRTEKYLSNLHACLATYTASKQLQHAPSSKTVLVAGGIGGLLSIVRFKRSKAHALLVILFTTHLVGLTITQANSWYIFYLLIFWLAFAAIAGVEAWRIIASLWDSATWRILTGSAGFATLIFCAVVDYRIFFDSYIDRFPFNPGLMACHIADEICAEAQDHDLYLPKGEFNKDLGPEIGAIGAIFPKYESLKYSGLIKTSSLFFPGAPSGTHKGIVAYLPAVRFWTDVQIPRLLSLYPHTTMTLLAAPVPWCARKSPPLLKLAIPAKDLSARQGFLVEQTNAEGWAAHGYFVAEKAGTYVFNSGENCIVEIGGTPADGPIILNAGTVAIQVTGTGQPSPSLRVYRQDTGKTPIEIEGCVFNAPPTVEDVIAPCVSKPAAPAQFVYSIRETYDFNTVGINDVTDAVAVGETIVCVCRNGHLVEFNKDLSSRSIFSLGSAGNYSLTISPTGEVFAFRNGGDIIYAKTAREPPVMIKLKEIGPISGIYFDRDGMGYLLTGTKVSVYAPGRPEVLVRNVNLSVSSTPSSSMVAVGPKGDIALLDVDRQELIILRTGEAQIARITIPGAHGNSSIFACSEGEWLVGAGEEFSILNQDFKPLLYPGPGLAHTPFREPSGGTWRSCPVPCQIHRSTDGDVCIPGGSKLFRLSRQGD